MLPLPYRYCSVLVTFSIPGGDGYGAASNADANLDLLVQPRVVGRSVLPSGCSRMYMDLGAHLGELPRAPDLSSRAFHSMRSIHICVLSLRAVLSDQRILRLDTMPPSWRSSSLAGTPRTNIHLTCTLTALHRCELFFRYHTTDSAIAHFSTLVSGSHCTMPATLRCNCIRCAPRPAACCLGL